MFRKVILSYFFGYFFYTINEPRFKGESFLFFSIDFFALKYIFFYSCIDSFFLISLKNICLLYL
jgi:hypothetical protein